MYGSKIVFVRLNVGDPKSQELAKKAKIRVVPTMNFVDKQGNVVKELLGALPKATIEVELKKIN
jgi:thioredoxin-related protein